MIRTKQELIDRDRGGRRLPSGEGRIIELGAASSPESVCQFRVKSVHDDHLVCRRWNGTEEGATDVLVAKPWCLRKNGQRLPGCVYNFTGVQTRTVTLGSVVETQDIIPTYQTDDVIFCSRPVNGTGVTVDGEKVRWKDDNDDGRAYTERSA